MGWQREGVEGHEGYVGLVLADGRVTSTTTGGGVVVRATDADVMAGYEIREYETTGARDAVLPWEQVIGWRITCDCGWHGIELPAFGHGKHGYRYCPEEIEERELLPRWSAHVDPLVGLGELEDLWRQARSLERRIAEQVTRMRGQDVPWAEIARVVGMTRQGAQQRWGSASPPSMPDGPVRSRA